MELRSRINPKLQLRLRLPCNFNGYSTYGNCEVLIANHIKKGRFGSTQLDGATLALALWWPKAIHEGGGTARASFDAKTTSEQQKALGEILSGQYGGGVFEISVRNRQETSF